MDKRSSRRNSWVLFIVSFLVSAVFSLFVYSRATQTAQENDHESAQTVLEASAIVKGCHRYGLIEYSHHPIGRAYLLVPVVGRLEKLEQVPIVVGVVAATIALFACLMVPAPPLVKVPILATFISLPWQGGFINWLGNIHQHSYNFSIFLLLIAVGITLRRAWLALGVLAFLAGWIGYDFVIIYAFTIATVRFLYWSRREDNSWLSASWAAIGETCFFLAVFIFDMILKLVQNTLYFSSAVMAQQDIFINLLYRTNTGSRAELTLTQRLEKATDLFTLYFDRFVRDAQITQRESLLTVCGILALVVLAQIIRTNRTETGWRNLGSLGAGLIASCMTILAWLFVAPNHAEPHLNIFGRLLLVPYILFSLCVLLGFSLPRANTQNASRAKANMGVITFGLSVSVFLFVPALVSAKIDLAVYNSIWEPLNAGIRHNEGLGAPLAARATASSTSPDSNVDGPLKLKGETPLIYPTDFWGRAFEDNKELRWMPAPQNPLPAWYQLNFPKPVQISHVALRFWDLPKRCGNHTPENFYLEIFDQNSQTTARVPLSSNSGQPTHQGQSLNLLVPVASSTKVTAARLVIEKTIGGDTPAIFDFHAFGKEAP